MSNRLSLKHSQVGRLIHLQTLGRPVFTPRKYDHLAKESYEKNAVSYRCVRLIAEAAAMMTVGVWEKGEELDEHPYLKLIKKPNPFTGKTKFLVELYSYLLLAGNAYIEVVSLDNSPRELFVLRPDRMKIVNGPKGYPDAYEYDIGGSIHRYNVNTGTKQRPVLHIQLFHPTDDNYGLSPVEAAAYSVDVHNQALIFGKSVLDNMARPCGALVVKDGENQEPLTEEQFTRLKKELDDKYSGPTNGGRPLVLEGGLEWQPMGMNPKDLEFTSAKDQAARDIALAFGVPPQVLGIPGDNTYTNYSQAVRALYRQTVIPIVTMVAEELTAWLSASYGDDFELKPDLDSLEALSDERRELWERVNNAKFLTVDERREATGYDSYEEGEGIGAKIYAPMNEHPLSDDDMAMRDGGEPSGEDPFEEDNE